MLVQQYKEDLSVNLKRFKIILCQKQPHVRKMTMEKCEPPFDALIFLMCSSCDPGKPVVQMSGLRIRNKYVHTLVVNIR